MVLTLSTKGLTMPFSKSRIKSILFKKNAAIFFSNEVVIFNFISLKSKTICMSSYQTSNDQYEPDLSFETIEQPGSTSSMGWLLPLLLLVLIVGLVLYFMNGNKNDLVPGLQEIQENYNDSAPVAASVPAEDGTLIRKPLTIRINANTTINALQNGVEKQLLIYLSSRNPADSISKNRWFDFDDLNFKSGSADLTDSSLHQVQNIVTILKAFPKLKIKIGGYTDSTGDSVANMKLSQARAEAVLNALKLSGANPAQLAGAEGYGSAYAKAAANAPDAEKARDRRISINVRAK